MTILHMETQAVRLMASQIKQSVEALRSQTQYLNSSAQIIEWLGPSRDEFVQEAEALIRQLEAQSDAGTVLAGRLESEVAEWENLSCGSEDTYGGFLAIVAIALATFFLSTQKVLAPAPITPRGNNVIGDPDNLDPYFTPQVGATCGFQATQNLLKAFGKTPSIGDLQESAGYQPGKQYSNFDDFEEMFTSNGVPVDAHKSFDSVDDATGQFLNDLKAGKGIIVVVDTKPLGYWNGQAGGHAIWVTGVRTNDAGEITHVICNDSAFGQDAYKNGSWNKDTGQMDKGSDGKPDGQGIEYPVDEFMEAWSKQKYGYVATKDPIPAK